MAEVYVQAKVVLYEDEHPEILTAIRWRGRVDTRLLLFRAEALMQSGQIEVQQGIYPEYEAVGGDAEDLPPFAPDEPPGLFPLPEEFVLRPRLYKKRHEKLYGLWNDQPKGGGKGDALIWVLTRAAEILNKSRRDIEDRKRFREAGGLQDGAIPVVGPDRGEVDSMPPYQGDISATTGGGSGGHESPESGSVKPGGGVEVMSDAAYARQIFGEDDPYGWIDDLD